MMAPTAKAIEQALVDGAVAVFRVEPDATTVNKCRQHASEALGLDEDFLSSGDWKAKSKEIIKTTVDRLLEGWEPDVKPAKKAKNGVKKRQTSEDEENGPKPKRRKNAKAAAKPMKKETSNDSDEGEKPKPKPKQAAAHRGSRAVVETSSDIDAEEVKKITKTEESPSPKRKAESDDEKKNGAKRESSDEEDVKGGVGPARNSDEEEKPNLKKEETKPSAQDDSDEYSDVIDEVIAPKRKKGTTKKEKPAPKDKKPKSKTMAETAGNLSPDEAEIKKLQGQLTKCGIRKLWHNELKRYGDDAKAKIRHLRDMLKDAGMEGRFSEQKAREIKEMRELKAEVEAAEEMNKLWGMGGRKRGARGKGRGVKMEESEPSDADAVEKDRGEADGHVEEDDDDEEEEEEEEESFAARRRRAQQDLAFLGDDSDSD